jgi:DNA invertase Pin-like site-specific DNA recombinase
VHFGPKIYSYACLSPFENAEQHEAQIRKLQWSRRSYELITEEEPLKARLRPKLLALVGNTHQVDNWKLKYTPPKRVIGKLNRGDILEITELCRIGHNAAAFGRVIEEVLSVGAIVHILEDELVIKRTDSDFFKMLKIVTDAEWSVQGDSTRGGHIEGRKRGRRKGRFPILNPAQEKEVFKMIDAGVSQMDVMRHMRRKYPELDRKERGFSQPTISRMLKRRREEQKKQAAATVTRQSGE